MSLSKNKIKYIHSLKDKKHRSEHKTFVAEGHKTVSELLNVMKCQLLVATSDFLQAKIPIIAEEIIEVSNEELSRISFVRTPQQVLGVFYQPEYNTDIDASKELVLTLDGIQDPGNMGTIVRLADWYGIKHIICSTDTVDIYNPKTVQATMGAIARVEVHYTDLVSYLTNNKSIPIYGTMLDGENIYEKELTKNGILIMGNEGNGIRKNVEELISHKLFVPNYPPNEQTSESLNVAIATAIVCAEFRRRIL